MDLPSKVIVFSPAMEIKNKPATLVAILPNGYYELWMEFSGRQHTVFAPISQTGPHLQRARRRDRHALRRDRALGRVAGVEAFRRSIRPPEPIRLGRAVPAHRSRRFVPRFGAGRRSLGISPGRGAGLADVRQRGREEARLRPPHERRRAADSGIHGIHEFVARARVPRKARRESRDWSPTRTSGEAGRTRSFREDS